MEKKTAREIFGPIKRSPERPFTQDEIKLQRVLEQLDAATQANIETILNFANNGMRTHEKMLETIPVPEIRDIVRDIMEERLKKAQEKK